MMHPYLLTTLELTPVILGAMLEHIPATRYDERPDPNRFTLREALAHLADWEQILLEDRMQAAVSRPGCDIAGIDEGKRAAELGYDKMDVHQQLELFKQRRHTTAEWLRSVDEADWEKFLVHKERGKQTLYDQANLLLGHDLDHIEHVAQFLGEKTAGTW